MRFDLKDVITLILAAIGAVLGIINTWSALDQKRVRMRVVPKWAQFVSHAGQLDGPMGCIEVVNLSAFPISVHEIGFTLGGDPRKMRRVSIPQPITLDLQPFARTLAPRHSVAGYFRVNQLDPNLDRPMP